MKKNSLILVLIFAFASHINAQSTASKQVSTFTIEAPQLHTHKTIWVYTPKSYDTSKEHYPVFYMFDAQNLFDASILFIFTSSAL